MIVTKSVSNKQMFPVFLSSLCKRVPGLGDLCAIIYEEIGRKRYVYVDEKVKLLDIPCQDYLETADELISKVRETKTFICILAGSSHGSPIKVNVFPSSLYIKNILIVDNATR